MIDVQQGGLYRGKTMRERIAVPPADEVVEYLFKPRSLTFVDRDFRLMMWLNQAHVLMLVRQGILSHEVGESLVRQDANTHKHWSTSRRVWRSQRNRGTSPVRLSSTAI